MKKNIFLYLGCLAALIGCVKEEPDLFDDPSAVRIEKAVQEYKDVLKSAEHGWIGNYYPEANAKEGGFAMFFKFDGNNVTMMSETDTNVKAGVEATSSWTINKSQGPVLAFDTYNPIINYFSEVLSSQDTNGREGDYEFVITGVSEDKNTISMYGKKRKNLLVLHRIEPNFDVRTYFNTVVEQANKIGSINFDMKIGEQLIGKGLLNIRALNMTWEAGVKASTDIVSFTYTDKGFVLHKPLTLTISGKDFVLEGMEWQNDNDLFSATANGATITLEPTFSPEYLPYNEYLGEWELEYEATRGSASKPANRKRTTVTLEQLEKNKTLRMHAPDILDFGYVDMSFDLKTGNLSFTVQDVPDFTLTYGPEVSKDKPEHNGKTCTVKVCFCNNADTGSITGAGYGLNGIWNQDKEVDIDGKFIPDADKNQIPTNERVITFVHNGKWSKHTIGMVLRLYEGNTSLSSNFTGNKGGAIFSYLKLIKTIEP